MGQCSGVVQAHDTESFRTMLGTLSKMLVGPLLAPGFGEQIRIQGEGAVWPAEYARIVNIGVALSNVSQTDVVADSTLGRGAWC